jgi:hypothetical protein
MKRILKDKAGVEPTAMKIMAGVILLAIGLGIGVAVYRSVGKAMPSFSIDLSPTSKTADNGENVNVRVSVGRLLDYNKVVTLSASYDSAYVDNVNFSPDNGAVPFSAMMTIHVRAAATSGTTTITVKGTGTDGVTASAAFDLTIT